MESIFDRKAEIESEFMEPLRDVVAGFIPLGLTRIEVAETLEIDPRSLRTFCENERISFPPNQPGRRERIREGRRHGRGITLIDYEGRRQCVTAWAEEFGMKRETLSKRLQRGKSIREALAY